MGTCGAFAINESLFGIIEVCSIDFQMQFRSQLRHQPEYLIIHMPDEAT